MLLQAPLGWVGTGRILKKRLIFPLGTGGLIAIGSIATGFTSGEPQETAWPEVAASVTSLFLLLIGLALFAAAVHTCELHAFIGRKPWKHLNTTGERCPFTGGDSISECVSCNCIVAEEAMWSEDEAKKDFSFVGDFVVDIPKAMTIMDSSMSASESTAIRWSRESDETESKDEADNCSEASSHLASAALSQSEAFFRKVRLNEQLRFRGNFLLMALRRCCVGCFIYHRAWSIITRLATTFASLAVAAALIPFAFKLEKLVGKVWPLIHGICTFLSLSSSILSVLLQVEAASTTIAFLASMNMDAVPKGSSSLTRFATRFARFVFEEAPSISMATKIWKLMPNGVYQDIRLEASRRRKSGADRLLPLTAQDGP